MGRPRLTDQRVPQILDAFEVCVAAHGLEGTSLQMVADQAGLARALIRHHVGNRDAVLGAWVDRAVERYRCQLQELMDALPQTNRAEKLAEYLFMGEQSDPGRVMDLIVASATDHAECGERIAAFLEEMVQTLASDLQGTYPNADERQCLNVAGGLTALHMAGESLGPLQIKKRYRDTWASAAQILVRTLEK